MKLTLKQQMQLQMQDRMKKLDIIDKELDNYIKLKDKEVK